jgi:RNA polymerase sigma factor (sigma-70 family)
MDQLLLPYLEAPNHIERQQHLNGLLLFHAAPVVRRTLRRRLGFYLNPLGINPHNQDAEDLYQEIMTKVVQALTDLRNPSTKTVIENLQQYVARIASNACNDFLRAKSPARARLKNNLRYVLSHHQEFAIWKREGETLGGFSVWRDSSKSLASEKRLTNLREAVSSFRSTRLPAENIKEVPLTKLAAELFQWTGSPIELDLLVNIIATLLEIKDQPHESVDDESNAYLETRVADSTLSSSSRLEEQDLLRRLWQSLKELSVEQRDVFCFGFEDENGRDLFTVLLEAEVVDFQELAQELGRTPDAVVSLWSQMPMDDASIAAELKTKRAQVQKWRFRALQRLRKGLLPFGDRK